MSRAHRARRTARRRLARAALAGLAIGLGVAPQFGCGREFFRHWADQDVSEAVFEKSRDPRFRMERLTIEPPALSRFANPYDADRQPAPPDDPAAEALSPTPQFPYHRLLVPAEGTGYRDLMDKGKRYQAPPPQPKLPTVEPTDVTPRMVPVPPGPEQVSPFDPGQNSGTNPGGLTPNPLRDLPNTPLNPTTDPGGTSPPQAQAKKKDRGVLLSAFQAPVPPATQPGTSPDPAAVRPAQDTPPPGTDPTRRPARPQDRLRAPTPNLDPGGPDAPDPNSPTVPRFDRTPDQIRADRAGTAAFQKKLNPGILDFNEANAAGFPAESRPYVVGPAEALQLALMNSRAYQFRLENVYVTALATTLQRFSFQPQGFAGFGPTTGTIPNNPANLFQYNTRESPGGQVSRLNLGSAAGFSKLLSFGGRIAFGFANQTVFNFLGDNARQPTVTSFLPIAFSQPFLRGGGRAVTLENLTLAERNLLYEVRGFARFRQTFMPAILTAGQTLGDQGTSPDPTPGYLAVIQAIQNIENSRRTVAAFEQVYELYRLYVRGSASSGISQIQVDQVASQLASQRGQLLTAEFQFKQQLDQYKQSLGLPPDLPMILDRAPLGAFRSVFNEIDKWATEEDHDPEDLNGILAGLPLLEGINIDDRNLFEYLNRKLTQVYADPEKQQEFLLAAERVALENRLDLMNVRAQLYDQWRQLAVTANGLQGVFTVNVNNNITTPNGQTNPFAFLDQSKQFSLTFNSELPLIRVAERNTYRLATINYNRQQRVLQGTEDDIKQSIRQQIYQIIALAENYEIAKTNLLVLIRQRDLSLQQIIAPPTTTDAASNATQQATQTLNLITGITGILGIQNQLISNWVQFQTQRLALYRDLGLMPYDEWEAFYEFFPTNSGPIPGAPRGG